MGMNAKQFQYHIRNWYRRNKRDLPWRNTKNPYHILVSEVMLQQTQVSRVLEMYPKFLRTFPSIRILARAPLKNVLSVWQGMGYNRRALYLKRIAEQIDMQHGGKIPKDHDFLQSLPGIGPYTARAISTFAFGKRHIFLETNIRRVFIHHFFKERTGIRDEDVLEIVAQTLPARNVREWYWALMDYGALAIPKKNNPNRKSAHYMRQTTFEGSRRFIRSLIIKKLLKAPISEAQLITYLATQDHSFSRTAIKEIIQEIKKEGFISEQTHGLSLR